MWFSNLALGTPQEKMVLVQDGVFDKIRVVLSSSHNPQSLIACCATVSDLAKSFGQEEFFFEAGMTFPLVGLLANQPDPVYFAALSTINQLASTSERHKQAVVSAGILPRIRTLTQSTCAQVGQQVCLIIASLCQAPDLRFELTRSMVPQSLVLNLNPKTPKDLLAATLLAIRVFASGDDRERIQLVDGGLFPRLVPLLTSNDPVISFNACAVVSSMAAVPDLRTQAVKAFAPSLVNLLWYPDTNVAEEAADALQNLAQGTDADRTAIIDAGVLPKLAVPLMTKQDESKFCMHACQLILNLGPKYFHQKPLKDGFSGPLQKLASHTPSKPLKKLAGNARSMILSA